MCGIEAARSTHPLGTATSCACVCGSQALSSLFPDRFQTSNASSFLVHAMFTCRMRGFILCSSFTCRMRGCDARIIFNCRMNNLRGANCYCLSMTMFRGYCSLPVNQSSHASNFKDSLSMPIRFGHEPVPGLYCDNPQQ